MKTPTVKIPVSQWIALHRRIGFAEGLLKGWLALAPDDAEKCKVATQRFLDEHDETLVDIMTWRE